LGFGDTNKRSLPSIIPFLTNIIQVKGGEYHTLFLNSDGDVLSVGDNTV
jgi:alpha-tubulin suppressor-like RCC1 family protein